VNPVRKTAKLAFNAFFASITLARAKFSREPVLIILTYHRVLPRDHAARRTEQPGMVISPESFQHHLKIVQSMGGTFVSLNEWLQSDTAGSTLPRLAFAITFDDGWQDNYQYAYPILKQHQVPATIFLVSRRINTDWQFWPEKLLNVLLNHTAKLSHPIFSWIKCFFPEELRIDHESISLEQADLIIQRVKELDDQTIEQNLGAAEKALPSISNGAEMRPLLNAREIEEMASSKLVDFGAHTQHHYRLNLLQNEEQLQQEIVGSLQDTAQLSPRSVPIFCYPNGGISPVGKNLVTQHYAAACTTLKGWNKTPCRSMELGRFNFHDGNGSTTLSFLATLGRTDS